MMIKRILFASAVLLLFNGFAFAEKPIMGVAIIRNNSPRSSGFSAMLVEHLNRIAESTRIFSIVNAPSLREEIVKYNCLEEKCLLRFLRNAEISLSIMGEVDDRREFMEVSLSAYGTDVYNHDRRIYYYRARIWYDSKQTSREYSLIAEEHAGKFMAKVISAYQLPVAGRISEQGEFVFDVFLSGTYVLYRPLSGGRDMLAMSEKVGEVKIDRGRLINARFEPRKGDYVLVRNEREGRDLEAFYYSKKKELTLGKANDFASMYYLLFTAPASALMPLIAPTVGYYAASDWQGLVLWVPNAAPYLYFEINGLTVYFSEYYKKKRTVPGEVRAKLIYSIYLAAVGGLPLFIDSYSRSTINPASNFQTSQSFLGNDLAAAYLSFAGGGGGHFYRGHRLWGYLYYHLNNVMVYFIIRDFTPSLRYNPLTRKYYNGKSVKKRGFCLLGAYGGLKIIECLHAVFIRDRIDSGEIMEESFSMLPDLDLDYDMRLRYGLRCIYRF
jgi:hypothetical protein